MKNLELIAHEHGFINTRILIDCIEIYDNDTQYFITCKRDLYVWLGY